MVPANELLALQQAVASSFDLLATVQRNTNKGTSDAYGTQTEGWVAVAGLTNVAAAMHSPNNSALQAVAESVADLVTWQIDLPMVAGVPVDVRLEDQILIGGQTLRVLHVASPESYQTEVMILAGVVKA